jgi:hypothetical protein
MTLQATVAYNPFNARCLRCRRRLVRLSLAVPDPTRLQQTLASLPHRGCGGKVVPIREGGGS